MRFPPALRALEHRDFRLFWAGQLVSLVGRWMQSVGQSWLVLDLTGSPLKLGIVGGLQFAPILLLAFVAGALADRFPERALLVVSQLGLMLPALALAALTATSHVEYWHVAVLAGMTGVANALDMPVRQSLVVDLVGKDDLMNAIALNSAVFNAARTLGPAVAGVLIARYGVAVAFLLNGLSFLAVVAALHAMETEGRPPASPGRTLRAEIADGLRYALGTPLIALVLGLVLAVSMFAINHAVLVPLLAREVLHAEVQGFGFLLAALGIGALVGAAILAQPGRERPAPAAIIASAAVVSGGIVALAAIRDFWLAAAVLFVVGAAQILFLAGCNTTLQVTAPDALRGRVMSLYTLVFAGVSPVGAFLVGSVAEAASVPAACVVGGGLSLACVLGIGARWNHSKP